MTDRAPNPHDFLPKVAQFELTSDDITEGGLMPEEHVFNGMGFTGRDRSPQLRWSGAPEGTRSFVVTAYDPDAPTGSGFWHWVAINLPADTTELPTGAGADNDALPGDASYHVRNDYGQPSYNGPAPGAGAVSHRYIFTVHAVDVDTLDVTPEVAPAVVGFNLYFHTLGRAQLITEYARKED
jgi:Raf kinase inhibitor-like YbhB/YbcL family protein